MSVPYSVSVEGAERFEKELIRLNSVRFDAVMKKQLTELLNRARAEGGTPFDTGQLRKSSSTSFNNLTMGYRADYAAHVEYGHRTHNGGYVEGQHYLQKNVEIQRPIYMQDLMNAIRKG